MNDVKFAFRQLLKHPGCTVVAVLTLALGIGANAILFSVVDAILLKPLPFDEPDKLVLIDQQRGFGAFSGGDFRDLREQTRSFSGVAAISSGNMNLAGDGDPVRITSARVSANLFATLGKSPMLGRSFSSEEEKPGVEPVVAISHGLWQRRFGGDPGVVGRSIRLDARSHTIVAVMPPGFTYPGGEMRSAGVRSVSPDYFRAMGIPLRQGRALADTDRETSQPVAVINEALARKYWPNENAIGRRVKPTILDLPWLEIVGVVGDVRHAGLDHRPEPELYVPLAQSPPSQVNLVVRTAPDASTVATSIRRVVGEIDSDQPVYRLLSMEKLVADAGAAPRFRTVLLSAFGGVALLLAAVGIYGVMAFSVAQRTGCATGRRAPARRQAGNPPGGCGRSHRHRRHIWPDPAPARFSL